MFSCPVWYENLKYFCACWSNSQKYRISMLLDLCLFIVLFTIPTDVVLSMWIGVGGWGWPSSWSISRMILASWLLMKSAPNYASASDAATSFSMVHVMAIYHWAWYFLLCVVIYQGRNIHWLCFCLGMRWGMRHLSGCWVPYRIPSQKQSRWIFLPW